MRKVELKFVEKSDIEDMSLKELAVLLKAIGEVLGEKSLLAFNEFGGAESDAANNVFEARDEAATAAFDASKKTKAAHYAAIKEVAQDLR